MDFEKIKEIVFSSDTKERKRFFRAASFAHPAKMILPLQIYLIENYTNPGETIELLDDLSIRLEGYALEKGVDFLKDFKEFFEIIGIIIEELKNDHSTSNSRNSKQN